MVQAGSDELGSSVRVSAASHPGSAEGAGAEPSGSATALGLAAFSDNIVFFVAPSDLATHVTGSGRTLRLGGLVEAGSIHRGQERGVPIARFRITDGRAAVDVSYSGILPDLFREGQGVVAHGRLQDGTFVADEILAKHDEKYMPPEVARSLKDNPPPPPARSGSPPR